MYYEETRERILASYESAQRALSSLVGERLDAIDEPALIEVCVVAHREMAAARVALDAFDAWDLLVAQAATEDTEAYDRLHVSDALLGALLDCDIETRTALNVISDAYTLLGM